MQDRQTYRSTLQHAVAIAGGRLFLAARMHVGVTRLRRWLEGREAIPDGVFLRAVDVIFDGYARKRH